MPKQAIVVLIIGIALLVIASLFIFRITDTMQPAVQPEPAKVTTMNTNNTKELKTEDIKVGTGKEVKSGDTVIINYVGTLTDGTKFDSSYDHGKPFETQIGTGQVIKGWDLGVVGMKIGGKRKLTIPPQLAYGNQAIGSIPANSTLIFEVELIDIK
jgi:FKBP-type peptidyl-prolyl cis-trans isomerase